MSEVKAIVLVDYRIRPLRKFIEKLYSESVSAGLNLEWAGYSVMKRRSAEDSFVSGHKVIFFDGDKYDGLMDELGVRKLGAFKILMIKKAESSDDSKMRILYCVPDSVLAFRLMRKVSKAASKNKIIGRPFLRRKKWDVYDMMIVSDLGRIIEAILEALLIN